MEGVRLTKPMWVQALGGAPAEMCSHYRELVVEVVVAVAVEAVAVVVLVNVGGGVVVRPSVGWVHVACAPSDSAKL